MRSLDLWILAASSGGVAALVAALLVTWSARRARRRALHLDAAAAPVAPLADDPYAVDPFADDPFADDPLADDRFGVGPFAAVDGRAATTTGAYAVDPRAPTPIPADAAPTSPTPLPISHDTATWTTLPAVADAELAMAREVQRRLSPQGVVRVPGFAVIGHNQMADACGGDWWSCHSLPDERLLIAVGDVTGHGLAAALVAVLARGIVEGVARSLGAAASPTRVMGTLATAIADLGDDRHAMTCCVIVLDPHTGVLQLASAGHPFPYVRRIADGSLEVLMARGAPLGGPAPVIGTTRARLEPGDLLLLSSDGLADRAGADGTRFGERRVRRLLATHAPEHGTGVRRLRSEILAAVRGFAADADADDDLTLVVCEYRERISADPELDAAIEAAIDAALDTSRVTSPTALPS
ncbi:MAG: serine/threonine-protein phosphatase [Kofleriaceae bacterium]|nr:serine/threonine-protein phosphatase [Myxococcales bacterium]MCB9560227.1 serine/threonine-protein phosphatase [Kofleriaceae bacterium]MCB9571208.1 serine/threonine-protein phosphatase [Kofleriaceae bacterium]